MPFSQIHLQYFLFYNSWHINVYPSKRPPSWVRPECCCIFRTSNVTQGGRLSYTRFNFFHRVPRVSRLAYYCGTFWGKILTPQCLPSCTSQVGRCFSSGKPLTVSIFAEIKIKAMALESDFSVSAVRSCKLQFISAGVDLQHAFLLLSGFRSCVCTRFVSPNDFSFF